MLQLQCKHHPLCIDDANMKIKQGVHAASPIGEATQLIGVFMISLLKVDYNSPRHMNIYFVKEVKQIKWQNPNILKLMLIILLNE